MFESAEIGHSIDKETYDAEVPALREALLEAQYELKQQARFPVIVLINGIEGAGKGETVKLLNEWMDPRMIDVLTFDQQTDEELARPPAWRYWRALPPKGRMGVFFGNWYSQMLQGRVHGVFKDAVLDQAITGAERLEQMLCDEGALIIKFWFHLSKKQMKARLKALKDDPLHSWRISPLDWQQSETYDRFVRFGERVLRRTSRDYAPWHVVEGVDPYYRSLAVGRILLDGLQAALANNPKGKHQGNVAPLGRSIDQRSLIGALDMTLRRKATVNQGRTDAAGPFYPALEYVAAAKDDASGLGCSGDGPCDGTQPPAFVCPVDGAISQFGRIQGDQIFQAKGHSYSTTALVGGDATLAAQFQDGSFATLYLSPRDYHRIHMPCAGQLTHMVHAPGDLFSVNPTTARGVPRWSVRTY